MQELQWGQTPFDHLTKDELLRSAQMMYSALLAAKSVLKMCRIEFQPLDYLWRENLTGEDFTGFWGCEGLGGSALEKVEQAIQKYSADYTIENIYQSFYRYAEDLLFDCSKYKIGCRWIVCDKCGQMVGQSKDEFLVGRTCSDFLVCRQQECGKFRELNWQDLQINSET